MQKQTHGQFGKLSSVASKAFIYFSMQYFWLLVLQEGVLKPE